MAALIWLPVSLLLAGLAGAITMGFGIAGVGIVGTVMLMAGLFQRTETRAAGRSLPAAVQHLDG